MNLSNISIRNYSEEFYDELKFLWLELGLSNPERGDTNEVIQKTLESGGKLFLLFLEHELIGSSWLTTDARRLYLHHFGIKKYYQGNGFAHILMKHSLDFAKKLNLQIKLEVHKKNYIAEKLYLKYGFKPLGDYNVMIIRNLNLID